VPAPDATPQELEILRSVSVNPLGPIGGGGGGEKVGLIPKTKEELMDLLPPASNASTATPTD